MSNESSNRFRLYTNERLKNLIANYEALAKSDPNAPTKDELDFERQTRVGLGLDPLGFALNIVACAARAKSKRVTYTELWHCYFDGPVQKRPNQPFTKPFNALAIACEELKLPHITTLVVNEKGQHSGEAVDNLYDFAVESGRYQGTSKEAYVRAQASAAEKLTVMDIRKAFVSRD